MRQEYSLPGKIYTLLIALVGYSLLVILLRNTAPQLSGEEWAFTGLLVLLSVLLSMVGRRINQGKSYLALEPIAYYTAIISLGPAVAGVVALAPMIRLAIAERGTVWSFVRNSSMYALMGIAGGFTYLMLGGVLAPQHVTVGNVVALLGSMIVVRLTNEAILLVSDGLECGLKTALEEAWAAQPLAWGAEIMAVQPALLTSLIAANIDWIALVLWLTFMSGGALAFNYVTSTRAEVDRRLQELTETHEMLTAQRVREVATASRLRLAAEDMSGAASRLAAALEQQQRAVAHITSSVEELSYQSRHIAESAGAVDSTSRSALLVVEHGQDAAGASVRAMGDLEQHVNEMHTRLSTLAERTRLIYRTLDTINGIAGDTHLLALNATIEAAGAGEHGRRFGAVAQQINTLADQAIRAAGEIKLTVSEIDGAAGETRQVISHGLTETKRYTDQVAEARRSMDEVQRAVGLASEMAQQIRTATEQQTQASTQVTAAMRDVAALLAALSAEGQAVYSAAANLRDIAVDLQRDEDKMASPSSPAQQGEAGQKPGREPKQALALT